MLSKFIKIFLSLFQEISLKECGQKGFLTQRYTKDRSKLYWYVGHNITFYLFFKRFL